VKIVIDHLAGSRRGQRQELAAEGRVRFGRHPDCEVSFDAHRDIDASSRHAELRPSPGGPEPGWVLVDVGSSNGTFVDGKRVTEAPVRPGEPLVIGFGAAGPRLRLFLGDDAQVAALGAAPVEPPPRRRGPLVVGIAAAVAIVAALIALWMGR
jgi:pSer/pThr/pTyr-binding forkhead associated (FHA) protein